MLPFAEDTAIRVLVTGSSGHLGEALVRSLRESTHAVVGIDRWPSSFTEHEGSITDRNFVRRCVQGVEAIIHAATLRKPHLATHTR